MNKVATVSRHLTQPPHLLHNSHALQRHPLLLSQSACDIGKVYQPGRTTSYCSSTALVCLHQLEPTGGQLTGRKQQKVLYGGQISSRVCPQDAVKRCLILKVCATVPNTEHFTGEMGNYIRTGLANCIHTFSSVFWTADRRACSIPTSRWAWRRSCLRWSHSFTKCFLSFSRPTLLHREMRIKCPRIE